MNNPFIKIVTYVLPVALLVTGSFYFKDNIFQNYQTLKKQSVFIPPPKLVSQFHFGFRDIIANSLWVRWIQNIEACGKLLSDRKELNIKSNEITENPKYKQTQKQSVCHLGWSYTMLDRVTDLSPKFRMPYSKGAPTLSVIAEDVMGAKLLFDKGVKNLPDDWHIQYRAAYHYIFELNDMLMGSRLLKKSADNGAPDWVYSYSAKISSQAGQFDFGLDVLKEYLEKATDEEQKKRIQEKIKDLESKKQESLTK